MSDCDETLKNYSVQHRPLLKKVKYSYSATAGVQNVLLVHGHTTVDVDATVLWVPGAYSWLNASLSTNSTFSTVRVVRFLPLLGFRSTVPVSSIFLNNLNTDDRHQPLVENSFRSLFAPFFIVTAST